MAKAKQQNLKIIALVLLALSILIGAVFYFTSYKSKNKKILSAKAAIIQTKTKIKIGQKKLDNIKNIQKEITCLRRELFKIAKQLPTSTEDLDRFLSEIGELKEKANVHEMLKFQQLELEPGSNYDRLPIEIEFIADYDSINEFFWKLSELGGNGNQQIVNISGVNLQPVKKSNNNNGLSGLLHVSCTAETFLLSGELIAEEQEKKEERRRR